MKNILNVMIGLLLCSGAVAQKVMKESHSLVGINSVIVANITGNVSVEGVVGITEIDIKVNSKKDLSSLSSSVKSVIQNDSLIVYIDHPCAKLQLREPEHQQGWYNGIYLWSNDCQSPEDHLDFQVSVPQDIMVSVQTINDGDIEVRDVRETLSTKNINGGIFLSGVSDLIKARTINGDVTIDYLTQPGMDAEIYSLNGEVTINLLQESNAILSFKSRSGDLYTNFDNITPLSNKVVRDESNGVGIKIKIDSRSRLQLGRGGKTLSVETFNGDVLLMSKKKTIN